MKASELRLGNLLEYCNQVVHVMEIKRFENVELGYFVDSVGFERYLSDKDLSPILLTEEWLEGFGFEKDEILEDGTYWLNNEFSVDINENIVSLSSWDWGSGVSVVYVHQLQNLHFALTGIELEYNN